MYVKHILFQHDYVESLEEPEHETLQQQNETNVQVFQHTNHLLEEWRAAQDIRARSKNQNTTQTGAQHKSRRRSLEEADTWQV